MTEVIGLDQSTHFGRKLWAVIESRIGFDVLAGANRVTVSSEPCPTQGQWSTTFVSVEVDGQVMARLVVKQNISRRQFDDPWRWGLEYEIAVYRQVLTSVPTGLVEIFAHWVDGESGLATLVMDQFVDAHRLPLSWTPEKTLVEVAQWLGGFHRSSEEPKLTSEQRAVLNVHDADFLRMWFIRATPLLEAASTVHPALLDLVNDPEAIIASLTEAEQCVIHGDCSPNNVIVNQAGRYAVIDWESAALGCGAVDLASLTLGWPDAVIRDCFSGYVESRWGGPAPADFEKALYAGRIYHGVRSGRPGLEDLQREKGQRRLKFLAEAVEAWRKS